MVSEDLPSASKPSHLLRACQAVLNILVLALFALLLLSSYRSFLATQSLRSFGVLAVNTLMLGLFVARKPAKTETASLPLWLLATAGTAAPLLLRPSNISAYVSVGYGIQVVGLVMLSGALLSLRRSFAVVPANRGVRAGGMYQVVRHPVYISELTVFLGVVIANPTVANLSIWLCECGLQFARALAEEALLSQDPVYRAYRQRVRYRLIPGLI